MAIYTLGFHIELSIQQILDCDFGFSLGCSGGYLEGPFNFMEVNGVETEFIYPYTSGADAQTGECRSTNGPYKIRSFRGLTSGDCNELQTALSKKPITVGITGTQLQLYSEGVFDGCDSALNHAVLVVGHRPGVAWKIKNSWGTGWGQEGYGWIADGNTCRICDLAYEPFLTEETQDGDTGSLEGQSIT